MAKKAVQTYEIRTRTRRRNRPHPFNIRKKLGPKSSARGMRKRKRGQG